MPIIFDFSLLLVVLAVLTGVIWALDHLLWLPKRPVGAREPIVVEYARSFFPIILIVLVVRSFLFEPFRIPSDSMMPTLLDGDFIFVNKFAYGLRLPVANVKLVSIGEPERGDVIVFRKPSDPSTNYIKRLVGLPGDRVEVRRAAIWVNGQAIASHDDGRFTEDKCYRNLRQGVEQLGTHEHRIMYCSAGRELEMVPPLCTSSRNVFTCADDRRPLGGPAGVASDDPVGIWTVPAGHYFFMGDNRDNSGDSRFPDLGVVPVDNVVGKAVRIWLNISLPPRAALGRIGEAIR
jgi:signal peptidase I